MMLPSYEPSTTAGPAQFVALDPAWDKDDVAAFTTTDTERGIIYAPDASGRVIAFQDRRRGERRERNRRMDDQEAEYARALDAMEQVRETTRRHWTMFTAGVLVGVLLMLGMFFLTS
jgi:hypothetical protein